MLIALHKPFETLSSFTHETQSPGDVGKRTLSAFGLPRGVYAAGRLDFDSEGLLLLSDDGALIHRLTDPAHKLPKTYWAQVEGVPGEPALAALRRGLPIKDYVTRPCQARALEADPGFAPRSKPITPHGPTAWLELVLREGRKRQVRHMTAAVGLPTLRLLRVGIGALRLGELAPGQWREITPAEVFGGMGQSARDDDDQTPRPDRSARPPARARRHAQGRFR